jgi:hypothetical protein
MGNMGSNINFDLTIILLIFLQTRVGPLVNLMVENVKLKLKTKTFTDLFISSKVTM